MAPSVSVLHLVTFASVITLLYLSLIGLNFCSCNQHVAGNSASTSQIEGHVGPDSLRICVGVVSEGASVISTDGEESKLTHWCCLEAGLLDSVLQWTLQTAQIVKRVCVCVRKCISRVFG